MTRRNKSKTQILIRENIIKIRVVVASGYSKISSYFGMVWENRKRNWLLLLPFSWSLSCSGHHWSSKKSFHFFQEMRVPEGHHSHIWITCNQLHRPWTVSWEFWKYNKPLRSICFGWNKKRKFWLYSLYKNAFRRKARHCQPVWFYISYTLNGNKRNMPCEQFIQLFVLHI